MPPALRDVDARKEREERTRAVYEWTEAQEAKERAETLSRISSEIERLEAEYLSSRLETLRVALRSAILGTITTPHTAVFGDYQVRRTDTNTFRIDVHVDLHGDWSRIVPYVAEALLLDGGDWRIVYVTEGTPYSVKPERRPTRRGSRVVVY